MKSAPIIIILVLQFSIASLCYWIYYDNPQLYVLGDEIEQRYIEISNASIEQEIKTNRDIKNNIESKIKILNYLDDPTTSYKGNAGILQVNDSLLVTFSYPIPCPKCDNTMIMEVYTKNSLTKLDVFYSKQLSFKEAIKFHLSELTKKESEINSNMTQLILDSFASPVRWSYLHFLNYYFSGQIEPMSKFLILMRGVKVSLWFIFSLVASSPFWSRRNMKVVS